MRRVLIAMDDSTCSYEAICQGAALLGPEPCQIRVLAVVFVDSRPATEATLGLRAHRAAEAAYTALDRAVNVLAAAGHHVEGTVRVGVPAPTIVEAAGEFAADLIVMGTHRRTGEALALAGSVAAEVLAAAPCGVLIFPLLPLTVAC